jgi:hypothetical protein
MFRDTAGLAVPFAIDYAIASSNFSELLGGRSPSVLSVSPQVRRRS